MRRQRGLDDIAANVLGTLVAIGAVTAGLAAVAFVGVGVMLLAAAIMGGM